MSDQITNTQQDRTGSEPPVQRPRVLPYHWRWPVEEPTRSTRLKGILIASVPWVIVLIGMIVLRALRRG